MGGEKGSCGSVGGIRGAEVAAEDAGAIIAEVDWDDGAPGKGTGARLQRVVTRAQPRPPGSVAAPRLAHAETCATARRRMARDPRRDREPRWVFEMPAFCSRSAPQDGAATDGVSSANAALRRGSTSIVGRSHCRAESALATLRWQKPMWVSAERTVAKASEWVGDRSPVGTSRGRRAGV